MLWFSEDWRSCCSYSLSSYEIEKKCGNCPRCLTLFPHLSYSFFRLNERQIKIGKLTSVQTNYLWACSLLLQLFPCFNTSTSLQVFSAYKPHAQWFVNALKSFCLNVRSAIDLPDHIQHSLVHNTPWIPLPACKRLLFPLLHAEKGRLRNAVANCVPASRWAPKILGTCCERLTHSAHYLT